MESSWTKVRQVVANRVLTRHLKDLQDQEVAMEKAQEHQKRQVERELRVSRTDSMFPVPSRRQSMPASTRIPTSGYIPPPTRRGSDGARESMAAMDSPDQLYPDTQPGGGDPENSSLLELMSSTLQSARAMEQQRGHLHPGTTARPGQASSGTQTTGHGDRPLAASTKSQRALQAATDTSPRLDRGESFIQTDQSQILSLAGSAPAASLETSATEGMPRMGDKTTKKQQQQKKKKKKGGVRLAVEQNTTDYTHSGAEHARPCRARVNVDFYDEDTGLKKDDGGFTPRDLSLALDKLDEEDEETDDSDDAVENDEREMALADKGKAGLEEEDPWSEVKRCQYIRGYDPPHMKMPKDTVNFVFGENGQT